MVDKLSTCIDLKKGGRKNRETAPPSIRRAEQGLSPTEAQRLVRQILREGFFARTDHFKTDRKAKRSASDQDVLHILETGTVVEKPEWSEEYQNWICKVEGRDLENETLKVVTAIIEPDWTIVVITVTGD